MDNVMKYWMQNQKKTKEEIIQEININ